MTSWKSMLLQPQMKRSLSLLLLLTILFGCSWNSPRFVAAKEPLPGGEQDSFSWVASQAELTRDDSIEFRTLSERRSKRFMGSSMRGGSAARRRMRAMRRMRLTNTPAPTPPSCETNDDCNDDQYCGGGVCRNHATCGTLLDCLNPSNQYSTIACVGYLYCTDDGQCSKECTMDGSQCINGDDFNCPESPCSLALCDEPSVACVDYNCGGCNALFINQAGNPVCAQEECQSTRDCDSEHFCAAGTCREYGTCGTALDCRNPENLFGTAACVGYLYCTDDGECGKECTMDGSQCMNGDDVNCFASPCDVTTCDQLYQFCVDDYCGGCNAIFYDAAGNQVCATADTDASDDDDEGVNLAACASDANCGDQEYCGGGVCRDYGTCDTVLDCLNPANPPPFIACVGYLYCTEDGQCGKECTTDGSQCANGDDVMCASEPCAVVRCGEPSVSCVNDYCGGCNFIFYNAAGYQVCVQ